MWPKYILLHIKNKLQRSFTRELESLYVCLSVCVCGVVGGQMRGLTPIYRLGCKVLEVSMQLAQISPRGLSEKS